MSLHVAPSASIRTARPAKLYLMAFALATALCVAPCTPIGAQGAASTIQTARASQALVLRSGPRSDAPRIATLAAGTRVKVFAVRDGWSQVTTNGRQGWVVSRALKVEPNVPSPAPRTEAPTSSSTPAPVPATPLQEELRRTPAPEPQREHGVAAELPADADTTSRTFSPSRGPLLLGVRTWLVGPGVAIGASGELMVTPELPNFGNGSIGVSVSADYISVTQGMVDASVIPLMAMANYHIRVPGVPRLDPFVAAGLGYAIGRVSASLGGQSFSATATSGLFFAGNIGARWYFTDRLGAQGGLLFGRRGGGGLAVGLSWRP